jgi:hypothetical protein
MTTTPDTGTGTTHLKVLHEVRDDLMRLWGKVESRVEVEVTDITQIIDKILKVAPVAEKDAAHAVEAEAGPVVVKAAETVITDAATAAETK